MQPSSPCFASCSPRRSIFSRSFSAARTILESMTVRSSITVFNWPTIWVYATISSQFCLLLPKLQDIFQGNLHYFKIHESKEVTEWLNAAQLYQVPREKGKQNSEFLVKYILFYLICSAVPPGCGIWDGPYGFVKFQ